MSSDPRVRATQLNEQELWREMVRWSGGVVHEEDGMLFVAGPSRYLRVAMPLDGGADVERAVARVAPYFGSEHILLIRTPDESELADAAAARGYRPGWTERPMLLATPPEEPSLPDGIELRPVTGAQGVSARSPRPCPARARARRCSSTTRCSWRPTWRRSSRTPARSRCRVQ